MNRFLKSVGRDPRQITTEEIRTCLSELRQECKHKGDILKSPKRFCYNFLKTPHIAESFKFFGRTYTPKQVRSKADLLRFPSALYSLGDKTIFLIYATSELRRNELLSLTLDDVDVEN